MTVPFGLIDVLAELYPEQAAAERLMAQAGIHAERVYWQQAARNRWFSICREAGKQDALLTW